MATPAPSIQGTLAPTPEGWSGSSLYITFCVAFGLFIFLLVVFDMLRLRLWWVYEPRLVHKKYQGPNTPRAPPRYPLGWVVAVMRSWPDETFLRYAGVDGLVIIYFMRFATNQCLFCTVVGLLFLVPSYRSGRGLEALEDSERGDRYSFSTATVLNIKCRFEVEDDGDDANRNQPLFPGCANGHSDFRFILIVLCAWLFTLRALSGLAANYQRFMHLRHWYLTSGLSSHRDADPVDAQRALTVKVERVPPRLRSSKALRRKFEHLCGAGTVHSAQPMVGDLRELNRLVARRDRAQDALEDAVQRGAKLATDAEKRLIRRHGGDALGHLPQRPRSPWRRVRNAIWFQDLENREEVTSNLFRDAEDPPSELARRRSVGARQDSTERHDAIEEVSREARRRLSDAIDSTSEATSTTLGDLSPHIPQRRWFRRRRDARVPVVRHVTLGCDVGPACGCLHGIIRDEWFVHSVPYYTQLVSDLDLAIRREHFARMEKVMRPQAQQWWRPPGTLKPDAPFKRSWRGCFWRVDDELSSDDDEEVQIRGRLPSCVLTRDGRAWSETSVETGSPGTSNTRDAQVRRDARHNANDRLKKRRERGWERIVGTSTEKDHWLVVAASLPIRNSCRDLLNRSKEYVQDYPLFDFVHGLYEGLHSLLITCLRIVVPCYSGRDESGPSQQTQGFRPSSTAFVTFTKPTAKLEAIHSLLAAQPFAMTCKDAPEPRDVLWENVFLPTEAVTRRKWVIELGLGALMVFWATIVTFCSSSAVLADDLFGFDPEAAATQAVAAILPVVVLLSILNLLPLIFQAVARFYERLKSHSEVDLSVVERFFRFQFVNVYVAIFITAILEHLQQAWQSPFHFVKMVGQGTPRVSFYFAKLLAFQCGTSPLWLLRTWPLVSRGFKFYTVQPPELPGMLYGWAFPKVMMTFTIFSTFWVLAPILSFIALIYFVLVQFTFRYLILYVHMPVYESGGLFYYKMVDRVLFSLTVSNLVLVAWLASRALWGYSVLVAPIPLVVVAFGRFAREAYEKPSRELPLDESRFRDHSVQSEVSQRFDAALYTQPALRDRGDLDVDAELAAMLRGEFEEETKEPNRRSCCGHVRREKEEEVWAVRRASLAGRRMTARVPDGQQPYEASREERRRVSLRLSAAYRGEADFFAGIYEAAHEAGVETVTPASGAPPVFAEDMTPPNQTDERDAARSALARLQEMDSVSSGLSDGAGGGSVASDHAGGAGGSPARRVFRDISASSDLATQPTDDPDVFVKPPPARPRSVELAPTRPPGPPMLPPPPPPPPGPPPSEPPPDTTTL